MSKLDEGGTQKVLTDAARGPLAKYQALVVGEGGWGALLKYELITGLFGSWPGAFGLWLRQKFYPLLLRECGRGVVFGRHIILRHPHRIRIGNRVVIGDFCTLDAKGDTGEGLIIRDGAFIGTGTIISMGGGTIEIDEGANIGSYCRIGTLGRSRIGKKALLAAYCYVVGGGHDASRTDIPILDQPNITKGGSEVGDGCWLGARVTVMDGVKVGAHSIVGAHAVVTEDLPEYCVAVGIPAKVIRYRKAPGAAV